MKFSDLQCCPFCGHDEYYTKEYWYGTIYYGERFDGKEAHNENMYDSLNYKNHSGRTYCRNCNKYLGNKISNNLSKAAQKKIEQRRADNG